MFKNLNRPKFQQIRGQNPGFLIFLILQIAIIVYCLECKGFKKILSNFDTFALSLAPFDSGRIFVTLAASHESKYFRKKLNTEEFMSCNRFYLCVRSIFGLTFQVFKISYSVMIKFNSLLLLFLTYDVE